MVWGSGSIMCHGIWQSIKLCGDYGRTTQEFNKGKNKLVPDVSLFLYVKKLETYKRICREIVFEGGPSKDFSENENMDDERNFPYVSNLHTFNSTDLLTMV